MTERGRKRISGSRLFRVRVVIGSTRWLCGRGLGRERMGDGEVTWKWPLLAGNSGMAQPKGSQDCPWKPILLLCSVEQIQQHNSELTMATSWRPDGCLLCPSLARGPVVNPPTSSFRAHSLPFLCHRSRRRFVPHGMILFSRIPPRAPLYPSIYWPMTATPIVCNPSRTTGHVPSIWGTQRRRSDIAGSFCCTFNLPRDADL